VWGGLCNRSACLKPGARWWNFGSHAYYCESCAYWLSEDVVNKRDAEETWGKGKRLCELQPTAESLPKREYTGVGT
jgi:hypothetical protein